MYLRCPKCGHAPLPQDQSLPAACGGCGVILAKIGQSVRRGESAASQRMRAIGDRRSIGLWLFYVPPQVDSLRFWSRLALLSLFAVWGWVLIAQDFRTGEMNSSFLHGPLLAFHEAGHLIFLPLGEWLMVLGGTLGQLIMPAVICGTLLVKNREPFGAALGLWFVGVSVLDVAPYVYDALHPQLILLGGHTGDDGPHDWIYLLSSLGWLGKAQLLGNLAHKLGALTVLLALAWGGWMLRLQYPRVAAGGLREDLNGTDD